MPSRNPVLINLRGDEPYARALGRLLKAVRSRGVRVETRHQLADYALVVLGLQHGIKLPPRARPVGTNRHGTPGD